ncbi:restriction endonuclease subunit S [Aurantimonas coralicida]|uniref:Type I restriction modification DNA specificity domain protein n=1 Tax=Aurantimonas coralicida TaxID=182270 RepID=A0A0P0YZA3_9HYPH|nr:restriction endonuclease subunit S [Aurantimonas coralicida]BAT26871.1 type I restriction modification DNA specificity domain protein [Aurantimonas coralicida]
MNIHCERAQGLKETGLGLIPTDWDCASLSEMWSVTDCKHVTAPFVASGFPLASIRETQSRTVDLSEANQTTADYYRKMIEGGRKPEAGDLIFSRNATVGEVAKVTEAHPLFAMGQDVCLLRKRRQDYSTDFIQQFLQSGLARRQFSDAMVGSTFKRMNVKQIKALLVVFPAAREQEVIAEALSDADTLIEGLERLIAKKRLIKQGAMQDLLTAKRRLPGFSGEWLERKLGEVARIATGSRNNQDKDSMGDFPFFVRSDNVERIRTWSYDCEAILVPGEGRIGEIFHYINGKFDVHQRVYCISGFTEDVSGRFIHTILRQFFGKHAMTNTVKATVDSLRRPTFTEFSFLCPPSLAEQHAIAAALTDMNAEIQALDTRLEKARQVKEGMMQNLLTGRIRLV